GRRSRWDCHDGPRGVSVSPDPLRAHRPVTRQRRCGGAVRTTEMAIIPQETVQEILDATDIVELIQGYFPLKRAGTNFLAICPFHNEKTPSFNINPQRQIFYCF